MQLTPQNRLRNFTWIVYVPAGAGGMKVTGKQGARYGGVSSVHAGSTPSRAAGGWVVVRVVYLHDKGPGSGSFQLSHETCSITDCRGKEHKTKDTHTINPKCNVLVTPTLQPTFPQRGTWGRRAHAVGGRGAGSFVS